MTLNTNQFWEKHGEKGWGFNCSKKLCHKIQKKRNHIKVFHSTNIPFLWFRPMLIYYFEDWPLNKQKEHIKRKEKIKKQTKEGKTRRKQLKKQRKIKGMLRLPSINKTGKDLFEIVKRFPEGLLNCSNFIAEWEINLNWKFYLPF